VTVRDTFDAFTPPERGRFGDNEQAERRSSDRDDLIDLPLYSHGIAKSGKAIRLSPNGALTHAQWVPLSLVEQPAATQLAHPPGGDRCEFGRFKVAKFKAESLGWLVLADDKQGALL
jgi:hypothetical protein